MVNIDTVYQKVLALTNKEQKGYITPQEFNLFANLAQMETFEQYFYDLNQFQRIHGNDTVHSDVDDMLEEKMQFFEVTHRASDITGYAGTVVGGQNFKHVPNEFYRVVRVEFNNANCEILNTQDFNNVMLSPLTRPTTSRPVVNIRGNLIRCFTGLDINVTPTSMIFYRRPKIVRWGYVVVNEKALFNPDPNVTQHFELHLSEEVELIYKILKLAGITLDKQVMMQGGANLEVAKVQQEKA